MGMNRSKALNNISKLGFAMDDVKLFLDTHPDCEEAIAYYVDTKKKKDEAVSEFVESFGPLKASDIESCNMWDWNAGPMPWEGDDC